MSNVLADRYEVGERLGSGGMSTVRLALDTRLERQVAIKILAEHLAEDRQFVSRFKREALSAAQLVHPNIVQVFDFGHDKESDRYFIVMEAVHGKSGAQLLQDRGYLSVPETARIISEAAKGLDHAHKNGVIHRDVKPGNILIGDDGTVKIADFGIAKAMSDASSSITQVGSVIGTASYLAPEQASGADVGPESDIYGLGVVTFQMLAGRLPYEADSLAELAQKQQREAPPLLDQLNAEVPHELGLVVDRALALDPASRYGSAANYGAAILSGSRGILADDAAHTTVMSPSTSVTRMISRDRANALERDFSTEDSLDDHPSTSTMVRQRSGSTSEFNAPRSPRRAPERPAGVTRQTNSSQQPRKKSGGFLSSLFKLLVIFGLLAALVAAGVYYLTESTQSLVETVTGSDFDQVSSNLGNYIQRLTR